MDFLIEILLEVYMELMFLIIPEGRRRKKHRIIMVLIASVLTFGLMALGLWGIYMLTEEKNAWGCLPLGIAIVLSAAQIIVGILLYNRRTKKVKRIQTENGQ